MTEDDFIVAITDDPSDTLPRLAYADWLEERAGFSACTECSNGAVTYYKGPGTTNLAFRDCPTCHGTGSVADGNAVRAEFIRVQCELAVKPICPDWCDMDPEKCRVAWLERCEREILLHRWQFDPPILRDMIRPWNERIGRSVDAGGTRELLEQCPKWEWRRGFIEKFSCPAATWVEHGPEIVRATPCMEARLTDMPIHPSGGNDTYFVGGLGLFPSQYWRILEELPSRLAAAAALSRVAIAVARSETRNGSLRKMPNWTPSPA